MRLNHGERSVLAGFPSKDSARRAAEELEGMGYDTVRVDRISRYGFSGGEIIDNPVLGNESPAGLTLFSAEAGDLSVNERVLRGSDPLVSGNGAAGYGTEGEAAFLLTVVTGEGNVGQVTEVVERYGGRI